MTIFVSQTLLPLLVNSVNIDISLPVILLYYFQVLAYRGQHWTLLQNAVRALWNCAHTALIRAFTNDSSSKTGLLTSAGLREVLWFPLAMACDHWIDMMFHIRSQLQAKAEVCT